jgi:hypothetical protein
MFREILFDTEGGTELLAIHRYEPISLRAIFVSFKVSPRNDATERKIKRRKKKKFQPPFSLKGLSARICYLP